MSTTCRPRPAPTCTWRLLWPGRIFWLQRSLGHFSQGLISSRLEACPTNFFLGTPQTVAAVAGRLSEAAGGLDQLTSHDAWRWALQVMRGADGVHRLPPERRPNGSGRSGPVVSGRPWNSEQICMRYARKHGLRLSTSSLVWSKIRATGDLSPTHVSTLQKTTEGREYLRVLLVDLWADWQANHRAVAPSFVTFQKDNPHLAVHIGYHSSIAGSLDRVHLIDNNSSQATQTYLACCEREGLRVSHHSGPFSEKHVATDRRHPQGCSQLVFCVLHRR